MALSYRALPQARQDIREALEWLEAEAGTKTRNRFMKDYIQTRKKSLRVSLSLRSFLQRVTQIQAFKISL